MLNYAIDERALADLINLVDAVIEECTDDDYARAMRRQRDWLVRRRDEVRRSLVETRADAVPGDWCNCQAIEGTTSYPGPWHPMGDVTCAHR